MCVVIMTPNGEQEQTIPQVVFDSVRIVAQVLENPIINRDENNPEAVNIPAARMAETVGNDLARTIVDGSSVVFKGLRQTVNEQSGLVKWDVTHQLGS